MITNYRTLPNYEAAINAATQYAAQNPGAYYACSIGFRGVPRGKYGRRMVFRAYFGGNEWSPARRANFISVYLPK